MKRHWSDDDFVSTYDRAGVNTLLPNHRIGYCRVCKCDMASFYGGQLKHFKTHHEARQLGLWKGKPRIRNKMQTSKEG